MVSHVFVYLFPGKHLQQKGTSPKHGPWDFSAYTLYYK